MSDEAGERPIRMSAEAELSRVWAKLTPAQRYKADQLKLLCGEFFLHEAADGSVRVLGPEEVATPIIAFASRRAAEPPTS